MLQPNYSDRRIFLKEVKEGTENDYLQALLGRSSPEQKQRLKEIRSEWYRKTTNSSPEDIFMEYGYVLREDRLFAYNWGSYCFQCVGTLPIYGCLLFKI